MSEKFTPGPWEACEMPMLSGAYRWWEVCKVEPDIPLAEVDDSAPPFISRVRAEHLGIEENEANARLIAKSPELYERLQAISDAVEFCDRGGDQTRLQILLHGIPNLLAETRGESA